jgi:hypothetical protein
LSRITPGSVQLRQQISAYVNDAKLITSNSIDAAQSTSEFGDVYHCSLSAEVVLSGLRTPKLRPRLAGARSIVLRVPLLVGIGQQSVAMVELRRFVELICWTVYFTDHIVEWGRFEADSTAGFSQDARSPISFAAHRQLNYYVDYARELMASEPSGLGAEAVDAIRQVCHELNCAVHPGETAQATTMNPPHDDVSAATLRHFGRVQRRVFSNCCILLAAYRRQQFDRLKAAARAHFDWLVGSKLRKRVRHGRFGL